MVPVQNLSGKHDVKMTKLMLYKPLFIVSVRVKSFLKVIASYCGTKTMCLSYENGHGTHISSY